MTYWRGKGDKEKNYEMQLWNYDLQKDNIGHHEIPHFIKKNLQDIVTKTIHSHRSSDVPQLWTYQWVKRVMVVVSYIICDGKKKIFRSNLKHSK